MTSLINRYTHQNPSNEQSLINSLMTESIKVMGRQYFYLPRDSQLRDPVLGEDIMASFTLAIPLEMYLVDSTGFQGQRELFTKFGLQINNSYRLVVSVDRWNKEIASVFNGSVGVQQASFSKSNYVRPWEGDLIYDPMTKFLMVIKFVDNDEIFFQFGKNFVYYLSCEAFLYQNEPIQTNVPEIDVFDGLSKDLLNFEIYTEANESIMQEDGDYLLQEENPAPYRDIEVSFDIPSQSIKTTIINPFGE